MAFEFDKKTKTIFSNRGDRGTIKLINTNGSFKVGDKIKFSIIDKDNYNNVIFQKIFTVIEEKPEFYLTLTSDDTRIGDIISKQVSSYVNVFNNVPSNCEIIVKDDTAKKWIFARRSDFTNVKTVVEKEAEIVV